MNLPQARRNNLLTTQLEEEVVVYDPERKQAHSLNRTAVAVWNHADGETSMAELQQRVSAEIGAPISEAAVQLALRKLERAHLLTEKLGSREPITRRHMLSQAGRFGAAAMLATPIVLSAAVPAAAAFCSTCGTAGNHKCICGAQITACTADHAHGATLAAVCYDNTVGSAGPCITNDDCVGFAGTLCIAGFSNPDHACAGQCLPAPCAPAQGCDCPNPT